MEFEQSYNGTPLDWSFPSPTATPTTGSFGNVFQTPKTSTYPTHFQDAFTTPQMSTYSTTPQPQYPSMTPVQRPHSSSDTLRSNYYAYVQAAGFQGAGQSMPQQGHNMVKPTYGNTQNASMQLAMNTSFGSTQMQTPPPTRGTNARKQQQPQQIAFGTPSTIASRRFMTPQQPFVPSNDEAQTQHNPTHFHQLQFSPDMYQYLHLGPASAPVAPQSKVFWAQADSPIQPAPSATLDDPFAPLASGHIGWPSDGLQQHSAQSVSFDTPIMNSFPVQPPHLRPASAVQRPTNLAVHPVTEASSAGVDPSLLYSSPIRPILRSNSRNKKAQPQAAATGTKEISDSVRDRSDTIASTTTSRAASTLQRSHTTATARPQSMYSLMSAVESLSRSSSFGQLPRTASPVKRFGRPPLGPISEGKPRQRTSVILTVDENGRARTETLRADNSPTRSIRERYPALFDSDSSDAESDGSGDTPSRPSSFIFEKRDERRSKAARLDPPVENLEGLTIPRSSSSASMRKGVTPSRAAVAAAASLRRQGSLRRSTPSRNQNRRIVTSSSATSLIDTCPMDVPATQQQAATGVEHDYNGNMSWTAHNDTFSAPVPNVESALDAHNRRWSIMSYEQQQSISPQPQQYPSAGFQGHPIQHMPPQHRQVLIRCVCGLSQDTGQPLIQCRSCTQWLHAPCVSLESQSIPPNFTCFLCTRPPTNVLRGKTASSR
ncbi:hypothetical protein LTR37_000406 [Vermiconidia calcicola]|uniref:Uncharacterized protein n=1 Tax=Vermiconidia calcicola TaxID=1690605 RepID=A0ACC3P1A5_9PEZI|nr:hypothetical protein LTR37_000406 [Vermiconidia calcicola]